MRASAPGVAAVLLLGVFALGTAGASDAKPASLSRRAAPAAAPIWITDKAASRLTFKGVVSGQGFDGVFKRWDAQIAFDPNNLGASRVAVTIDLGSVVTGDPTRDQMLPTGDWFAVQRFPKASFVSTAITATGPGRYQALGDLSIKGQTRRVALPFNLVINKDVAKMDGGLTIDRRQFGVGQGQFAGVDTVGADVQILVRLTAKTAR
jgi:polyisoprenoid-binding protein YceI